MKIFKREEQDVIILDVEGRITIGDGDVQVREAVHHLLDTGKKKILINMGRVSYIDSSGIGELLGCLSTASGQGAAFKLLNLSTKIRDVLHIAQILSVFEYFDNEPSALASFE